MTGGSTCARFSCSGNAHSLMSFWSCPGVWDGGYGRVVNRGHYSSRELLSSQTWWFPILVLVIVLIGIICPAHAQSTNGTSNGQLALNQEIFFQTFSNLNNTKVRTAVAMNVNLTGDLQNQVEEVSVVRLRTGSLRRYGYKFNEIRLPQGVKVVEPVRSVILVYRRFKNYKFYNVTMGETLVAPVVGILVYNAANLSTFRTYRNELTIVALESPIVVASALSQKTDEARVTCVMYNNTDYRSQAGTVQNRTEQSTCTWTMLGDYSLVGPRTKGKSNTGKIVAGSVAGGVVFVALLLVTLYFLRRYRHKAKFKKMQSKSDEGDTLQDAKVGGNRAPVAGGTRTKGKLEKSLS